MLKAYAARNEGLSLPASQKLALLHTGCFLIYITMAPHLKVLSTSKGRRSDLSSVYSVQSRDWFQSLNCSQLSSSGVCWFGRQKAMSMSMEHEGLQALHLWVIVSHESNASHTPRTMCKAHNEGHHTTKIISHQGMDCPGRVYTLLVSSRVITTTVKEIMIVLRFSLYKTTGRCSCSITLLKKELTNVNAPDWNTSLSLSHNFPKL